MGYSNFKEGSPGAKKRDEIAETLKKDVVEKAWPALGALGAAGLGLAIRGLARIGTGAAAKKVATATATKGASKAGTSFKGAFKKPGGTFKKPTAGVGGTAGSGGAAKGAGVGGAAKGAGAIGTASRAANIGAAGATLLPDKKREQTYHGTSVRH